MITLEQAEKLTTKRLLAYYKKNGHNWETKIYTDTETQGLDEPAEPVNYTHVYNEMEQYWQSIKELLDKREHVKI